MNSFKKRRKIQDELKEQLYKDWEELKELRKQLIDDPGGFTRNDEKHLQELYDQTERSLKAQKKMTADLFRDLRAAKRALEWQQVRSPNKLSKISSIKPAKAPCEYCKSTQCDGTWSGYLRLNKQSAKWGKNEKKKKRAKWTKSCFDKQPKKASSKKRKQ